MTRPLSKRRRSSRSQILRAYDLADKLANSLAELAWAEGRVIANDPHVAAAYELRDACARAAKRT